MSHRPTKVLSELSLAEEVPLLSLLKPTPSTIPTRLYGAQDGIEIGNLFRYKTLVPIDLIAPVAAGGCPVSIATAFGHAVTPLSLRFCDPCFCCC